MRTSLAAILFASASWAAAAAEAPLSAIDWLSDSVALPSALPRDGPGDVAGNATAPDVETRTLGAQLQDGVGLVPAEEAGLPSDLWGVSTSAEIAALLRDEPLNMPPAARALLKRVLLAELRPPADADASAALLVARIDKLLSLGALEEAQSLLDISGRATSELFRRRFDVALLTGAEDRACGEFRSEPGISPTYPVRIFCYARTGDWPTAAITFESAAALGLLDASEEDLLARFLHPDLAEDLPPLPPPSRPSPLIFRLHEAIGEPLPTGTLPLPFAHSDLRPNNGWKAQLDAAERLARVGAIDSNRLFGLYTERRPAASGGVWDRATAVQSLEAALIRGNREEISRWVATAWTRMQDAGLETVFAAIFGERFRTVDLAPGARSIAFRASLLTPNFAETAASHAPTDPEDAFLAAVALGRASEATASDPLRTAIRDGFAAGAAPSGYGPLIDGGRKGEAVLAAISLLASGAAGNLADVRDAIALLRALGLETTARRAAVELVVLSPPA